MIKNAKIILTKLTILMVCIVGISTFYIVYKFLSSDYLTVGGLIVGVLIPMVGLLAIAQTIMIGFWGRNKTPNKKVALTAIICLLFVLGYWFLWSFLPPGAASKCFVYSSSSFWNGNRCVQPQNDQEVLINVDCSIGNCDESYADTNRYQPFIWAKIFSYLSLTINLVVSLIMIWVPKRKLVNGATQ
jgi:hypothetical protein